MTKVTTIITSYNHQDYIEEAINSALWQFGDFEHEIIISDDGSSDETPLIAEKYEHRYPDIIKNISERRNYGISENMKRSIAEASGEYIDVIEGDDVWINPFKIDKQLKFLKKERNCHMCFSGCYFLSQDDCQCYEPRNQTDIEEKINGTDLVARRNPVITFSSCMFNASILKNIPKILYEINLSELALAFYFERFGYIGHINDKHILYRQHNKSAWSSLPVEEKHKTAIGIRKMCMRVCRDEHIESLRADIGNFNNLIAELSK